MAHAQLQERPSAGARPVHAEGLWWWLLQRFSGALLLFFVAAHLWAVHMAELPRVIAGLQEEPVLYEVVKARLAQGFFIFVDVGLLALTLYHGLNGVRGVLLEWAPARRRGRAVTRGLVVLGTVFFVYGAWALLAFIL